MHHALRLSAAISAFNSEDLKFRQIFRMDHISRATPNVAISVDDVYVPRIQGPLFALYDGVEFNYRWDADVRQRGSDLCRRA